MSKFSLQNYLFYQIEILGTVLKQPIRIQYLIKEKPRGALALQVNRITEGKVSQKSQVQAAAAPFFYKLVGGIKPLTMDLVSELNNLDTKRNKFLFFKNASFDSRAIESRDSRFYRLLILLSYEIQGCLYGSEVLLFRHINFQRKPLFGNRKYN